MKLNKHLFFKAFQYAESAEMKVVGYYQACERLDDTALAPVGEKVASKIKAQFDDAIAFVVRQILYALTCSHLILQWKIDGDKLATAESALFVSSTRI